MENKLILRKNVKTEDTWNLTLLYKNDKEFESDFKKMEEFSNKAKKFKGNLSNSANELKNILDSIMKASIILEKLGGGGHITLAGAQLEGLSIEDAKHELIIRINEYLLENE